MNTTTLSQTKDKIIFNEIPTEYHKKWVIVEITKRNQYGLPDEGIVLYASNNKQEVIEETIKKKLKEEYKDLYFFYTGRIEDDV